jgi:hypothetical protein
MGVCVWFHKLLQTKQVRLFLGGRELWARSLPDLKLLPFVVIRFMVIIHSVPAVTSSRGN